MAVRATEITGWQEDYGSNLPFPFNKTIFYKTFYRYH